ncbi:hypothetical protein BT69DRAFT_1348026 [Atractiella rhizophila]|nr:hypothetical protein BT69DRAFT_1348026 [Atractiella rhizophila]
MFLQPNQASTSLNLVLTPFSPIIVLYFREKLKRSRIDLRGGWGRLPLAVIICFAGQLYLSNACRCCFQFPRRTDSAHVSHREPVLQNCDTDLLAILDLCGHQPF